MGHKWRDPTYACERRSTVIGHLSHECSSKDEKLTRSLELGGSKRTLEPAVLGTYLKPTSVSTSKNDMINCRHGAARTYG